MGTTGWHSYDPLIEVTVAASSHKHPELFNMFLTKSGYDNLFKWKACSLPCKSLNVLMASTWEHETWYTWMWLSGLAFLIYHDLHQQSSQFFIYSWEPPCYKWLGNQDFNSNHFLHVFKYLDFLSPKFVNTSDRLGLRKKWSISLLLGNCELAISVCLRRKSRNFPQVTLVAFKILWTNVEKLCQEDSSMLTPFYIFYNFFLGWESSHTLSKSRHAKMSMSPQRTFKLHSQNQSDQSIATVMILFGKAPAANECSRTSTQLF